MEKCAIKLERVEGQEVALYTIYLHSNWKWHNELLVTAMVAIPDGILGQL